MSTNITKIPIWKLDKVYNALRLTSNIHKCSEKKTAYDRIVTEALDFVYDILFEQGLYYQDKDGKVQKDYSKL